MDVEAIASGFGFVLRSYSDTKFGLEQSFPFNPDWLHLLAGPAILVAAALVLRRPLLGWAAWLVVVAVALINEAVDIASARMDSLPLGPMLVRECLTDTVLTIAVPTALLLLARCFPGLFETLSPARASRR